MINVILLDLPVGVSEMVTLNEDGSYSIFLNARLSATEQRTGYLHALDHIENGDFYSDMTAQDIESLYQ